MPDKGGIDCKNKKVIVKRMRIIPCVSQLPYFYGFGCQNMLSIPSCVYRIIFMHITTLGEA